MRVFQPASVGVGVGLLATAAYLPDERRSNAALEALGCPMTAAEMERLSGVVERRIAAPDQATSDLAAAAATAALACAGRRATAVDRILLSTTSPDHLVPSTACLVAHRIGVEQAPAVDLAAACGGFLFALDAAMRAIATGDDTVLAIAAEIRSRFVDPRDRATGALLGDGAVAALLERCEPGTGLVAVGVTGKPTACHTMVIPAGGSREPASALTVAENRHVLRMVDGARLYAEATEGMVRVGRELLDDVGLRWSDIDLVVPHQPNRRLLERLARLAGLPADRLFVNVERLGNTSSAACGIALDEALRSGRLVEGNRVLLVAGGAGYTAGAALLRVDAALLRRVGVTA